MIDINKIPSPCYVMEEKLLRNNLSLIKSVKERAGVNIILAFKAFALWKAFPIVREYIPFSTASSKFEAQLAFEEMGSPAHTYSPAYTEADFPLILRYSSHVTFNSLSQFHRFYPMVRADGNRVSCGLRINPEYSDVETDLYNPCAPGSRMGVTGDLLGDTLPEGIEGLHFHTLCESTSYDLERTLAEVERRFGRFLPHVKFAPAYFFCRRKYKWTSKMIWRSFDNLKKPPRLLYAFSFDGYSASTTALFYPRTSHHT